MMLVPLVGILGTKTLLESIPSRRYPILRRVSRKSIAMTCPKPVDHIANYADSFDEYIEDIPNRTAHLADYLQNFRELEFDSWYLPYANVAKGMHHWKSTHLANELQSGAKIYESACGIGLNLFMTMEVLAELGVTNVEVYGNEFMAESVEMANAVLDQLAPTAGGGRKGMICQGDSSSLQHVPSDTFDLVYTGYLSYLDDPVGFNKSMEENRRRTSMLCRSDSTDWRDERLLQLGEEVQGKWISTWMTEMIRIAKPGQPVIVEQMRRPGPCHGYRNVRGISEAWWGPAIEHFGWGVDPASLEFEDDTLYGDRYHVKMRKKRTSVS